MAPGCRQVRSCLSGGSWEGCGAGRSKEVGALASVLCCGPGCGAEVLGCSCSLWSCGAGECKPQAVGARRLVSGPYPRGAATKAGVAGVQKLLTGTPRLYSRAGWREEKRRPPPHRPLRKITARPESLLTRGRP